MQRSWRQLSGHDCPAAQQKLGMSLTQAAHATLIGKGPNFGLNVLDGRTLQINLTHASAYFLEALDYPTSFPVDPLLIDEVSERHLGRSPGLRVAARARSWSSPGVT